MITQLPATKPILSFCIFQQETFSSFTNTGRLTEKILNVLKEIHGEKDEDEVKVDMWCHFGHAYITKVDEGKSELFHTHENRRKLVKNDIIMQVMQGLTFKSHEG